MDKRILNATETKKEFIHSIHRWLMDTLGNNNKHEYKKCFTICDSSIIVDLPTDYFHRFNIPENTRIEMKFITKRN